MTTPRHTTRIARFGFVNAYLVAEDDGLTLVDTLIPRSGRPIRAAADALGAPIRRIVLTHAHGDHTGSLDELADALGPDLEVLVSARDARLLAGDMGLEPGEHGTLRGSYKATATRPTRTLQAGDRVGSLEVVAAPGHTPGHIALLDVRERTLLCGDAYSTLGGVATTARPNPRFPLPGLATYDRALALESARALRALKPAFLAPGHGRVVADPGAAMDRAIARGA